MFDTIIATKAGIPMLFVVFSWIIYLNFEVMLRLIVRWVLSDTEGRRTGEEMHYLIRNFGEKTSWKAAILKDEKAMGR